MVIKRGGVSTGGTAGTSASGPFDIPLLSTGEYPKWVHVVFTSNGKGGVIAFGSGFLDSTIDIDTPNPTLADPVVVTTASSHSYSNDDEVVITGSGMTELNGRVFTIDNVTADTFELVDEAGDDGRTTGAGGTVAKNLFVDTPTISSKGVGFTFGAPAVVYVGGDKAYRVIANNSSATYVITPLAGVGGG